MGKPRYVASFEGPPRLVADTITPDRTSNAYRGASNLSYDVAAWNPRRGSADGVLLSDLPNLVARSRDIDRNNAVAKGAKQTIVDNVVGTGLRLSSRPDWKALGKTKEWADEFARQYEAKWCAWWWTTSCHAGDTMTGDHLTALQFRTQISSGEFLALPLWLPGRDRYATKIQTVDPDRLSANPSYMESSRYRGGIAFDPYGAPIAYDIKRTHPGDSYYDADAMGWERVPKRTPAGRLRVIHGYDCERSGQSRGVPMLSAILPQFKQIDRYTNAELMAAVVNAMIAMVIEAPLSHEQVMELFKDDGDAYNAARQAHAVSLQSGTAISLFPGDKAASFLPQRPATGFGTFCENIYRIMGVGLDLPYELVMKDFSKTNYSSARAALLEAWRSFRRRRDNLATQWLDPCASLFLEELVNAREIDAPDFYANRWAYERCKWIGPGRGWIDPVKEAEAAKLRVASGFSTLEDECAEQGNDWREVLEQRAREIEYADELGVTLELAAAPVAPPAAADAATSEGTPPGSNNTLAETALTV